MVPRARTARVRPLPRRRWRSSRIGRRCAPRTGRPQSTRCVRGRRISSPPDPPGSWPETSSARAGTAVPDHRTSRRALSRTSMWTTRSPQRCQRRLPLERRPPSVSGGVERRPDLQVRPSEDARLRIPRNSFIEIRVSSSAGAYVVVRHCAGLPRSCAAARVGFTRAFGQGGYRDRRVRDAATAGADTMTIGIENNSHPGQRHPPGRNSDPGRAVRAERRRSVVPMAGRRLPAGCPLRARHQAPTAWKREVGAAALPRSPKREHGFGGSSRHATVKLAERCAPNSCRAPRLLSSPSRSKYRANRWSYI